MVRAAISDWGNLALCRDAGRGFGHGQLYGSIDVCTGDLSGALVAGWGSDKLFNGNRGPMNLIFAAGIFALCGFFVADAVRQLYVMRSGLFLHHRFLCPLKPQIAIGMAAAGSFT